MKILQRPLPLAGLVFVLIYILPLGLRPLFLPDEVRYAEIAREMLSRGDWMVPQLNGLDYFEKPIFGHWAHALSQLLFGDTLFAVRFPSALATGLTALLLVRFGHLPTRSNEEQNLGPLAALIFLTSIAVVGIGTFAVLDNLLSFFLALALVAFFLATEADRSSRKETCWLLVAGVGCGLAFLTKGFLALAIPVLVATPYLIWQRRWRELLRLAWLPLLTAALVSLPWSLLIHQRAPDFWNYFFWQEHVKRFFSGHAQHAKPVWFFVALLPAMLLPWTFQLSSIWQGFRLRHENMPQESALLRYALCWLIFPLVFFSASSGKLLTYILPCFPALAVLIAIGLDRSLAVEKDCSFNLGALLAGGFFTLLLLVLLGIQLFGIRGAPPFAGTLPWLGGTFALLLTIIGFVAARRTTIPWQKLMLYTLAPIPFFAFAPALIPDQTLATQAPVPFLSEIVQQVAPDDFILADGNMVSAVSWSLKRDDIYLFRNSGELAYGLSRPGGQGRYFDIEAAARLIGQHPGHVLILAKGDHYQQWADKLPHPASLQQNILHGFVALRY